jgi:hypothetical protein
MNPVARNLFTPSRSTELPSLDCLMHALYDSCSSSCAFQYALPLSTPDYLPEDDVNVASVVECETEASIPPSILSLGTDYIFVEYMRILYTWYTCIMGIFQLFKFCGESNYTKIAIAK